jgi:hypothetical protein
MSHVKADMLEEIVKKLDEKYGSDKVQLTVTHGKIHDYLGMTLDYSVLGKAAKLHEVAGGRCQGQCGLPR